MLPLGRKPPKERTSFASAAAIAFSLRILTDRFDKETNRVLLSLCPDFGCLAGGESTMKQMRLGVLAVGLLVSSCSTQEGTKPREKADDDWPYFSPAKADFRIQMPGKPEMRTGQVPQEWYPKATPSMLSSTAYMYFDPKDFLMYGISVWDCPKEARKDVYALLDHILQHIMSNKDIDWYGNINLGQYAGREYQGSFSAQGNAAKGQGRIYYVNGQILVLTAMGPEVTPRRKSKIDKFMKSLEILR
jgi:hypothetical protein